jgi:hypothetical protein
MSDDKELPVSRFAWRFSRPGDEFDRSLPEAHSSITVPQGGHQQPFTCVVTRTFKRRLHSVTGHPIVKDDRSNFGH